ncbi:MAG TPA: ABC transporter ATP-binding protein [Burkholderiaceae bacterium]|nr:ABC transporter ATP-binding protein [Burkholderiaceae bacterium]
MIELRGLTKWYRTERGRHYVFRDLNFSFPTGANIGLIGRNGAGKTTLMRMLGGMETPNLGRIVSDVRISWPVGLASGYQNTLSARENAQFICRIHGTTRSEMRRKIEFVRDFADIGEFFDLPMKTYSSGMRSRVAFGMSMAFDFDYYLIDEVMAVGDPQFREKGTRLLAQRLKNANVILVSHRMTDIRKHCNMVVHVDRGNTVLYDDVEAGIAAYDIPTETSE